jgi:Protein of unknown function (DUF2894)
MAPDVAQLRERLQAVQAGGVSGAGAIELAVIEGLLRRAGNQAGEARTRLLLQRASLRLQAAAALARPEAPAPTFPSSASTPGLEALSSLVRQLNALPPPGDEAPRAQAPRAPGSPAATDPSGSQLQAPARSLTALAAHGSTWARLRSDQRLREARAQIPAQAGPLHAAQLVYRALQAMQRLSPGYLEAFMAHVEGLTWMEQSSGAAGLPARPAPRAEAERKSRQASARKR